MNINNVLNIILIGGYVETLLRLNIVLLIKGCPARNNAYEFSDAYGNAYGNADKLAYGK